MANMGHYKQLPWPENLWTEAFGCRTRVKPPEDWKATLSLFTDSLTKLEKRILYGWYRDKKTAKQLEAELKCTGVATKKSAIMRKIRYDRCNRDFYLYGMAKSKLMPPLSETLFRELGLSLSTIEKLIVEIATNTTISQMTSLEREVNDALLAETDKHRAVEVVLNKYGLTMLKTRKVRYLDPYREYILEEALDIIQKQSDREELAKRIVQTMRQDMANNLRNDHLIPALASGRLSTIFKALTGGDMLNLLCRAGIVVLHEAERGTVFWGEVKRADTLPPITEEEQQ